MRKNVKQQLALRVLSTAALMAMVSSIATAAFAAEYNVKDGSVEIVAKDGVQRITQWADKDEGTFVKDEKGYINNRQDDDIILTTKNKDTGETETTSNTVTITAENKGDTANVTLQDVNIQKDQWDNESAAMTIKGEGDTEIELNGDNTLISGNRHAGLEKADDVSKGSLTIKDDLNNDNRTEKEKDESGYSTGGDTGTLKAAGGFAGAGIGGRKREEGDESDTCAGASNITITGGTIKAGSTHEMVKEYPQTELGGAGIGGASDYGNATNITITGNADVSAAGGYYAAGIGGGEYGNATNITISGNAKVTAAGSNSGGAGIGGGDYGRGSVLITDNADVTAYGGNQGAGIGGGGYRGGSVEISGNAKVFAVGANGSAGIGSGEDCFSGNPELTDTSVTISDNANVTAVGSYEGAAIGTGMSCTYGKTTINITGGTVTAIGGKSTVDYWNGNCYKDLTSAIGGSRGHGESGSVQDVTVTINGTTGNTTINASCWLDQKSAISTGDGAADIIGYDEDGKSPFGEDGSVIVRMYNNGSYTRAHGSLSKFEGDLTSYDLGDLYQTVHNRKYMEEHPEIVDISKLKDEDLHDWKLVGEVVQPTLEKDGYADYICSIDKCGQTKHVVLPKLTPEPSEPDTPSTPETPDTPDTPNKPDTPKQPDGTTPAPVTPDAPAQDGTAPADTPAADTTAAAQNVVQDAKPEAAAAPTAAPAAAAVLPQTGANWLAVVGSALSGMFLLAAGFVLDRKNRRMN